MRGASAALLCWTTAEFVRADQLTVNGHHQSGARVVGLNNGRVEFRTAGGEMRQADLAHLDVVLVERGDAFADFNQAERYASEGEWGNALLRYKRASRLCEGFWSDIIAARMLRAADRAKRVDEAVSAYLRVIRIEPGGALAALSLFPAQLPTVRDAAASRALQQLDDAAAAQPGPEQRLAIDLLGFEILRSLRDPMAMPVAVRLTEGEVPRPLRVDRVYASISAGLEMRLADAVTRESLAALDRAMLDCPGGALPDFLLMKGRAQLRMAKSREEFIRASWPFLRVVAHMPDDARAAEGLLGDLG
jgi:hypothetical protein